MQIFFSCEINNKIKVMLNPDGETVHAWLENRRAAIGNPTAKNENKLSSELSE